MALGTKSNKIYDQIYEKVEAKEKLLTNILLKEKVEVLNTFLSFKLRETNELSNLGYAASGVIHDITGPLSVIAMNLEFVYDSLSEDYREKNGTTELKESISTALECVHKITLIIENFRSYLTNNENIEKLNLENELLECLKLLRDKIFEQNIELRLDIDEKVDFLGNRAKFYQLMLNLLTNAIEALDHKRKNKRVFIIANEVLEKDEKFIKICIIDNGKGVKNSEAERLFEPMYTTKPGTHMGLGLHICKEIVEKDFGGTITLQSKKDENGKKITVVELKFPKKQINI